MFKKSLELLTRGGCFYRIYRIYIIYSMGHSGSHSGAAVHTTRKDPNSTDAIVFFPLRYFYSTVLCTYYALIMRLLCTYSTLIMHLSCTYSALIKAISRSVPRICKILVF